MVNVNIHHKYKLNNFYIFFSFGKNEHFYLYHLRLWASGCPQLPHCNFILWEIKAKPFHVFFVISLLFFDIHHFSSSFSNKFQFSKITKSSHIGYQVF